MPVTNAMFSAVLPSNVAPPAVSAVSSAGTADSAAGFARADHTHQSSIQAARITVTTGNVVRWTFPIAFDIAPNVVATCENASGATQPFVVNLIGQATTTYVDVQVFKGQATTLGGTLLAIAGMVVSPFTTAAQTSVQLFARKPTVLP